MAKIEVKIKFITPAFIGGVDKLQKNEFRTASFKGLLRYWWRALCSDNLSLQDMKKREEEIFGGQQNKSPFVLRIKYIKYANNNDRNILKDNTYIGIKYLFYPFYQNIVVNNQRKNFLENGKFINSGSELTIEFIFKKNDTNIIKEVLKALWALENFGGIGARSRRGAGSFKVIGITGIDENIKNSIPKFLYEEEKNKNFDIGKFIDNGLIKLNSNRPNELQTFTRYTNGYFNYKIIYNLNNKNWYDALNNIGNKYKDFRRNFRGESQNLHNFLINNNQINQIKRAAFGLPIIFRFKHPSNLKNLPNNFKNGLIQKFINILRAKVDKKEWGKVDKIQNKLEADLNAYRDLDLDYKYQKLFKKVLDKMFTLTAKPKSIRVDNKEIKYDRRASPMFIKVGEIFSNKYYILVSIIWSKFLPNNINVEISNELRITEVDQPDKVIVDEFLNNLR